MQKNPTKPECERAIRALCGQWAALRRETMQPRPMDARPPSFTDFYGWAQANHGQYLRFRSTTGVQNDVERWFDHEFHQMWRN